MTPQELIAHFFDLELEQRAFVLRYILKNIDATEFLAITYTLEDDDWDFLKTSAEA